MKVVLVRNKYGNNNLTIFYDQLEIVSVYYSHGRDGGCVISALVMWWWGDISLHSRGGGGGDGGRGGGLL